MEFSILFILLSIQVTVLDAQQMDHRSHGAHSASNVMPAGAQHVVPACRPGWERSVDTQTGQITCLWYSDVEATFIDAWNWCSILNAHPTAVFSNFMQSDLCFRTKQRKTGNWWLGITDMESRGFYKLAYNGESVTYFLPTSWLPGKPSSSLQNRCVFLDNDKCQLSDDACTSKHRFICQGHY